jgi:hypothetical protein
LKETQNNMNETKDTVANAITVMGTGSVVMGWNEALTFLLLITGIVFNIVRIIEIKKRKSKEK